MKDQLIRLLWPKMILQSEVKYSGLTLDAKLHWRSHVKRKTEENSLKYKKHYWLLGGSSQLSLYNKALIYKQVFKPIWLYCAQLWSCAKDSNITIIQKFQNKVLWNMVNAPLYVQNTETLSSWASRRRYRD